MKINQEIKYENKSINANYSEEWCQTIQNCIKTVIGNSQAGKKYDFHEVAPLEIWNSNHCFLAS